MLPCRLNWTGVSTWFNLVEGHSVLSSHWAGFVKKCLRGVRVRARSTVWLESGKRVSLCPFLSHFFTWTRVKRRAARLDVIQVERDSLWFLCFALFDLALPWKRTIWLYSLAAKGNKGLFSNKLFSGIEYIIEPHPRHAQRRSASVFAFFFLRRWVRQVPWNFASSCNKNSSSFNPLYLMLKSLWLWSFPLPCWRLGLSLDFY